MAKPITREQALTALSEEFEKVMSQETELRNNDFQVALHISRRDDWPVKLGCGPSWVKGTNVRDFLEQFDLLERVAV